MENVAYPICPLDVYFEGDEDKCDVSKCDFDTETRSCNTSCRIKGDENMPENKIRKFDSGAIRDTDVGKPSYVKALSPIVLQRYVKYLGKHRIQSDGNLRDFNNWKLGIDEDTYLDGLGRHFLAVWLLHDGFPASDNHGPVTLEDSLCAIIFGASGWLHELLKKKDQL